MSLPGTPKTIGPYELVSLLGRGGMGAVYRARHTALNCIRAVKLIPDTDPMRTARFLREAGALARIRHANVVSVHEVGHEGPVLYFAMDLVEGGRPLDALIRDELALERGLLIVEEAARGLHAVHEAGLVHRDVKPANIVVDGNGHAFVIDLGLVSSTEAERLTRTGVLVGTPAYFAPEYVLGLAPEPDRRVDVYALGAILYEIATGSTPIDADTPQEFFAAIASERPLVRPSVRRPGVPAGLDEICERALALRPQNRYSTALQLANDVAELRAGKRPSHASSALGERALSRRRSVRKLAVLAGALASVVVAAGVGLLSHLRTQRVEASLARAHADLDDLETRMRKPTHPEADAVILEKLAAEIARRALADASRADASSAGELSAVAVRARLDAGALALWRHDVDAARAALEPSFAELNSEVPGPRVSALAGGIAALASPSMPASWGAPETHLSLALEKITDRGDLYLWRAVARARLGDRARARADAQRANVLGFHSRKEELVVLALTGDPEEARKAILAQPGLTDPAFARPFTQRLSSLVAARGAANEMRAAALDVLRFTPPGTPELRAIARTALDRAGPAVEVFVNPLATIEAITERVDEIEPLVEIAHLVAPDEQDPSLGKATREAGVFQGNKGSAGTSARLRLAVLGTLLDPGSVDNWVELAIVNNGFHQHPYLDAARAALAHAKLVARTARDRGTIACEECVALSTDESWEAMAATARAAIDPLEAASTREEEVARNQLFLQLGRALSHLGRPEETLAFCDRAEKHDYARPLAPIRGRALVALGRVEEALALYHACLTPAYMGDVDLCQCAIMMDDLSHRVGRPLIEVEQDLVMAEAVATAGDDHRKLRLLKAAVQLERGDLETARKTLEVARVGASADREPAINECLSRLADPKVNRARLAAQLRHLVD